MFVFFSHSSLALFLGDNLTSILHDDLVRAEAAVASHAVATIRRLDDFYTNAILATLGTSCLQIGKGSVVADFLAHVAVVLVAFVKHAAVLAVLAAGVVRLAYTLGLVISPMVTLSPVVFRVANKSV